MDGADACRECPIDAPGRSWSNRRCAVLHPVRREVSAAGVRCVWQRHDLETMQKGLKASEAKSMREGLLLSESLELPRLSRRRRVCGRSL